MRKLHKIANVFTKLGLDSALLRIRKSFIKDIPILTYHRIVNLEQFDSYPYDSDLISANADDFQWQMKFIRDRFTPISINRLCDYVEGKDDLPKNPVMVTFDDGFDDNYHVAFPILKELEIPATLFVTTSFVDEKYTIWYERLAHFLYGYEGKITIPQLKLDLPATAEPQQRRTHYQNLVERLKVVPNSERISVIDDMYQRYSEDYDKTGNDIKSLSRPVNWEQLKEMSQSVFDIGSHTISHPVLTMLTDTELAFELTESKKILENRLETQIRTIAYPVGMDFAFDDRVMAATEEAGYTIGLSYMEGRNNPNDLLRYELRRMHVDYYMPRPAFSCKLAFPSFFND